MSHAAAQRAYLLAHPDAAGEFVWSIAAEVHFTRGATLACRYTLSGDMARLRVPQTRAGRRADGLWRQTCFEAFVSAADTAGYYEFNFSPALDWAAYRFTDYRTGMSAATLDRAPALHVRRSSDGLELDGASHRDHGTLRRASAARGARRGDRGKRWSPCLLGVAACIR